MSKIIDNTFKVATLIVLIFSICLPIYVSYDILSKGDIPPKKLELTEWEPYDSFSIFSHLNEKNPISIKIGDELIDDIFVAHAWLKNAGDSPILPKDFHENLAVNVSPPWKILAVKQTQTKNNPIKLKWFRVSPTRFESKPALLNPGDETQATVYLTNTEPQAIGSNSKNEHSLKLTWTTRITNLKEISEPSNSKVLFLKQVGEGFGLGPLVILFGWSLVSILIFALLFFWLYLWLLEFSGLLRTWQIYRYFLLGGASLLAICIAEVFTFYILGSPFGSFKMWEHFFNLPIVFLHFIFIIYLYKCGKKASMQNAIVQEDSP